MSNRNLDEIRETIMESIDPHLAEFLPNAQHAMRNLEDGAHATFTVSVGFTKKVRKRKPKRGQEEGEPEVSFGFYVNARESIPKPIERFKLDQDTSGQLRLL